MNSFKRKIQTCDRILKSIRHNPGELQGVIDLTLKTDPKQVMIVVVDHDPNGQAHYTVDLKEPRKAIAIFDQLLKTK